MPASCTPQCDSKHCARDRQIFLLCTLLGISSHLNPTTAPCMQACSGL